MRGVERRAAVLAELQAGDAATGDAAVESALYAFRSEADYLSMGEWPQCFWAVLLAQPSLQRHAGVAILLEATDRLAELGNGPRAAVLLQLAAGLDEHDAATVMGVGLAGYRLALRQAVSDSSGRLSEQQVWQQLHEQVQRRIRTLAAPRLSRLARVREAALRGALPEPEPEQSERAPAAPAVPCHRRGLLAVLWGLLALCVLAFAATFWWPFPGIGWPGFGPASNPRASRVGEPVRIEALPAAEPPAQRYDPVTALISHPDFERLADPEAAAVADDLAFFAWLAADAAGKTEPTRPVLPDTAVDTPVDDAETEAGDAL